MKRPVIGVLTWRNGKRFAEPAYFRRLIREGEKLGATVFLFAPHDVAPSEKRVRGFVPDGSGNWRERWFAPPDAVFDRYRYTPTQAFRHYVAFRRKSRFLYVNNRLANKWRVHQVLAADEGMRRWLPETVLYKPGSLVQMLHRHPLIYLKPINGTGGRNILRIEKTAGGYRMLGRDKQRATITAAVSGIAAVQRFAARWAKGDKYVVQQGLRLQLIPNRAVDMRLLIQKDGSGEWKVTGHAMRVGGQKSATSNLHGGGKAVPALTFLSPRFGTERTEQIVQECEQLAQQTARTLENHFGRMAEFGLDIGIDLNGRAWLIEVNPKPGREVFRRMGMLKLYRQAISRPLEYALHLAERHREKRLASG